MAASTKIASAATSMRISANPLPLSMMPHEMGERQGLADDLRPLRHAAEREGKARQQDIGQEEEECQLHCLQLVLRDGREGVADREVGSGEKRRQGGKQRNAADDGHAEQKMRREQDDRRLHEARSCRS